MLKIAMPRSVLAKDLQARTDRHRLVWLLQFAQADLSRWKHGDWLNVLEDLADLAFPASLGPAARPLLKATPDEARERVQPIQREVRRVIEKLAPSDSHRVGKESSPTVATVQFSGDVRLIGSQPHSLRVVYAPKEPSAEVGLASGVLLRLVDILARLKPLTLKRCPECERLFLANRKQKFDTSECSAQDRARRLRGKASPPRRGRRAATS